MFVHRVRSIQVLVTTLTLSALCSAAFAEPTDHDQMLRDHLSLGHGERLQRAHHALQPALPAVRRITYPRIGDRISANAPQRGRNGRLGVGARAYGPGACAACASTTIGISRDSARLSALSVTRTRRVCSPGGIERSNTGSTR